MQPRLSRFVVAAMTAAGFLTLAPRASADYILDGFDNPNPGQIFQISLLNGNPYTSPTTTVSAGVTRTIQVTVSSTPVNFNSASGTIGGGSFSMDTDNVTKASSKITFALSGAASNLSGATGLSLGFLNLDAGNSATSIPVTVQVVTATGTRTFTDTIGENSGAFTKNFNFSSFTGSGNLSQVNSIVFTLNGGSNSRTATDFALDSVNVKGINKPVPAPPALLLAGVGVLALVGRARLGRKPAAV